MQNHLLQVFALVAMEPPAAFDADPIRDEKAKLLRATRPMTLENAVRGQYGEGYVAGERAVAYLEEPNVPPDSNTPTYIAAKLEIDNWRWAGTPFYIRAGKRLAKRVTEVAVQFKRPPHLPFPTDAVEQLEANALVLRIQPDEGISLRFGAKAPTPTLALRTVNMDFLYGSSFLAEVPEAYETLILDAMRGDGTLFTRQDGVERSWELVDPLLEQWRKGTPQVYRVGLLGPRPLRRAAGPGRAPVAHGREPRTTRPATSRPSSRCCAPPAAATAPGSVRAITLNLVVHAPTRSGSRRRSRRSSTSAPRIRCGRSWRRRSEGELRASVASSCWVGASDRQVCSERVLVEAGAKALPSAVTVAARARPARVPVVAGAVRPQGRPGRRARGACVPRRRGLGRVRAGRGGRRADPGRLRRRPGLGGPAPVARRRGRPLRRAAAR